MKECAACNTELSQDKFSKKQWKLKQHERRCKDCIDTNREVLQKQHTPTLVKSNTTVNGGEEAPSCYICLDDEPDESGGEVRRDCSCRGPSAGFVHLSCLAKYAEDKYMSNPNDKDRDLLWKHCPTCKHEYQSEFAVDLAKLFVTCMKRRFKSQPFNINIIRAQIAVLENLMVKQTDDERQPEEAKQIANDIIRKYKRMKLKGFTTSHYVYEAYSYECLANLCQVEAAKIYKNGGGKEHFSEALKYFEKSLGVAKANNDSELITRAESMISTVRANMGDGKYDTASILKQKKMYEARVREGGESSVDAVNFGVVYAETIRRVQHRGVESERLFMNLREICQQVHGSDHKLTKHVHSKKGEYSVRMRSEGSGDSYVFFDYDGSFEKCMGMNQNVNVLKEILAESKEGGGFRLPIDSLSIDDVVFDNGTIVYSSPQPIESNSGGLDKFIVGDMRRAQLYDQEMFNEYDQV